MRQLVVTVERRRLMARLPEGVLISASTVEGFAGSRAGNASGAESPPDRARMRRR